MDRLSYLLEPSSLHRAREKHGMHDGVARALANSSFISLLLLVMVITITLHHYPALRHVFVCRDNVLPSSVGLATSVSYLYFSATTHLLHSTLATPPQDNAPRYPHRSFDRAHAYACTRFCYPSVDCYNRGTVHDGACNPPEGECPPLQLQSHAPKIAPDLTDIDDAQQNSDRFKWHDGIPR
jgi:hypothetical protein